MNLFQKHYYDVVQQDLLLTENVSSVSLIAAPKKISLSLGGDASHNSFVISSLAALKIITYQQPHLTSQNSSKKQRVFKAKETVGGKVTLRRSKMFNFWEKLLFEVFPFIKQFDGFTTPKNKKVFCFTLKDIFVFQELVPLFAYFEEVKTLQCQFHFASQSESEILTLGRSLLFCFSNNLNK